MLNEIDLFRNRTFVQAGQLRVWTDNAQVLFSVHVSDRLILGSGPLARYETALFAAQSGIDVDRQL